MLGLTDRQMRRLVQRYRAHGPEGLASKKRGMRGNHRRPESFRDHILAIVRERYADFAFFRFVPGPRLLTWDNSRFSVKAAR